MGHLIGSNYTGSTYTGTAEGPKKSLSGLVSLSSGYTSATLGPTVAVDESGDVYAWGINSEYRSLGHPNASFSTSKTATYEISPLPAASYANAKYGYGATAGTDGQISVWGLFRGRNGLDYITSNNQQGTPAAIPGTLGARGVAIPLMIEEDTGSGIKPVEKPGFYLDAEGRLQMFYWKTDFVEGTNPVEEFGEIKVEQISHSQIFVAIAEAYEGVFVLSEDGEVYKYTPVLSSYTIPQYSTSGQLLLTYSAVAPNGSGAFSKIDVPNFYDQVDSNGDEIGDLVARFRGLNPDASDTNLDGISDYVSLTVGLSPSAWDNDGDGIPNAVEIAKGLNPNSSDSDGDGMLDNEEFYLYDRLSNYILPTSADSQGPTIHLVSPGNATAL